MCSLFYCFKNACSVASYPQAGVSPGPVRGSQGYWVLPPLFAQSNKVQGPVDQCHLWLVPVTRCVLYSRVYDHYDQGHNGRVRCEKPAVVVDSYTFSLALFGNIVVKSAVATVLIESFRIITCIRRSTVVQLDVLIFTY